MFLPVLSHLAAKATSYYVHGIAVTIIIITKMAGAYKSKNPFSR